MKRDVNRNADSPARHAMLLFASDPKLWGAEEEQTHDIALMQVKSNLHVIAIDNLPTLYSVKCSADSVLLKFNDVSFADGWGSAEMDRLLLIDSTRGCGDNQTSPDEFTSRVALSFVRNQDAKTIEFQTVMPTKYSETQQLMANFEFAAYPNTLYDTPDDASTSDRASIVTDPKRRKRGAKFWLPGFDIEKKVGHNFKHVLKPENSQFEFDLGGGLKAQSTCTDCVFDADSSIGFHIKGDLLKWDGEFFVNWAGVVHLKAMLEIGGTFESDLGAVKKTFSEWQLPGIYIPGILDISPKISFNIAGSMTNDTNQTVSVGFDSVRSMDITVDSNLDASTATDKVPAAFQGSLKTSDPANNEMSLKIYPMLQIPCKVLGKKWWSDASIGLFNDLTGTIQPGAAAETHQCALKQSTSIQVGLGQEFLDIGIPINDFTLMAPTACAA